VKLEAKMAKGQMRSNKEAKKPKKSVATKPKAGAASGLTPAMPAKGGKKG
jgi:hypothetical protein